MYKESKVLFGWDTGTSVKASHNAEDWERCQNIHNQQNNMPGTTAKQGSVIFYSRSIANCPGEASLNCRDDHWKLILARSRFTNDAELHYTPGERESLALIFELESCWMFVLRCPDLLLTVNYQLLTRIFSDQVLENMKNPRLLNFKEQTLM